MTDIVPDMLADILEYYEARAQKVKAKSPSYDKAYVYAGELAKIMAEAVVKYVTQEALPDGVMYYNIASRVFEPVMKRLYADVSAYCMEAQEKLNGAAGFGFKAQAAEYDADRVRGVIEKLTKGDGIEF